MVYISGSQTVCCNIPVAVGTRWHRNTAGCPWWSPLSLSPGCHHLGQAKILHHLGENCYPAMALCCCNRLLRKKGTAPKVIWKILVYTIIMVYATDVYYDFIFRNITWRRTCILLTYFLLFLCSP